MSNTEKQTISDIILNYCVGYYHLEFDKDDLPIIIEDIKKLVKKEIMDYAEHVDDAIRCIDNL